MAADRRHRRSIEYSQQKRQLMQRLPFILPLLLMALIACDGKKEPAGKDSAGDTRSKESRNGEERTGGSGTAAEIAIPYDVTPEQRRGITALVRSNPEWRVADDADNRHGMLENMRRDNPGYRPYFTVHDFNRDGTGDFAITLIREGTFRSYWFKGISGGYADQGYAEPVLLVEEDWLANGGQIISSEGDLLVGEFYTDHLVRFVPHSVTGGLRAVVSP
jgi:hypothetical protein